ncbi:hypothetical protein [Bradyrhizobium sp.]|jgi:hypothetical protein|uniref:hypothetical protein n=1 Tax=Bradyrhizobium sp. TaxID=376 RepID=UPI003C1B2594
MFAVIFVVQPKKGRMDDYRNQAKLLSKAKVETISELSPAKGEKPAGTNLAGDLGLPKTGSEGVIDQEVFESITNQGKLLLLVAWRDATPPGVGSRRR